MKPIILSEVVYLHPSMFPQSWDFHIRKGKVIELKENGAVIDPWFCQCYGHEVFVAFNLIEPSQEFIQELRNKGKRIQELKSAAWR